MVIQEFEEKFDKQIKKLQQKYSINVINEFLYDWIRRGQTYFATSPKNEEFFRNSENKLNFCGMLLTHVVKMVSYYDTHSGTRTPQEAKVIGLQLPDGKKTRLFIPNVSYSVHEVLNAIVDDGVEEALMMIEQDDFVLENLIKSLTKNRYTLSRKNDIDNPLIVSYPSLEGKNVTNVELFDSIQLNTDEKMKLLELERKNPTYT